MSGQSTSPVTTDPSTRTSATKRPCILRASSCTMPEVTVVVSTKEEEEDLAEPGPFYGMFDGCEDDDASSGTLHVPVCSPRGHNNTGNIPEASETFQRVMRQLDDAPRAGTKPAHDSNPWEKPPRLERKSSKVKKSASFSTSATTTASSSTTSNSSSSGPEVKRRLSVPCTCSPKHVQWADEAGVAALVSVRHIRPRLASHLKEEAPSVRPARSILRRLSGMR
ncbi:hypothetical protein ACOMHN_009627 [Nucella lapillus]